MVIPSLPIMFLRSSVSSLLRAQVHCVLTRSVHSVAVIGAPFSQGQVRVGTRADRSGSPERVAWDRETRMRRNAARGGVGELAGSRGWHRSALGWNFP